MRQDARREVAEISARDRNDRCGSIPLFEREEIIELLREPACDIYRIGRSQMYLGLQITIGKGVFCKGLAVVECSL